MRPTNTAEIALNVERYVLPKFKVAVDFAARKTAENRSAAINRAIMSRAQCAPTTFLASRWISAELTIKASGDGCFAL